LLGVTTNKIDYYNLDGGSKYLTTSIIKSLAVVCMVGVLLDNACFACGYWLSSLVPVNHAIQDVVHVCLRLCHQHVFQQLQLDAFAGLHIPLDRQRVFSSYGSNLLLLVRLYCTHKHRLTATNNTAAGLNSTNSGCNKGATWCMHDTLINQHPYNPNTYDLEADYTQFGPNHMVTTAYLIKSVPPSITLAGHTVD
jgi:hypothetical protein